MPCLCRLETLFSAVFVLFLPVYHFLLDAQFSLFIFRMYCSHDLFFFVHHNEPDWKYYCSSSVVAQRVTPRLGASLFPNLQSAASFAPFRSRFLFLPSIVLKFSWTFSASILMPQIAPFQDSSRKESSKAAFKIHINSPWPLRIVQN